MKFKVCLTSLIVACAGRLLVPAAYAVTNTFFTGAQTATVVSSNINIVEISSGSYRFTYTADGYWSAAPGGTPTGRFFSVFWPSGIQAQAITAGPDLGKGANITIKRADGKPFDLWAFTGKLLANTAGTGGAFEIMPLLNGEDALNDPVMFDCSGYGGQSFPHTPRLAGYDTYKIHLWVDWALTALTLIDTNPVAPPDTDCTITASASPAGAGTVGGGGVYTNGASVVVTANANNGFAFANWTEGGTPVSSSATYSFTATVNRSLVANFVANAAPLALGGSFFQLTGRPLALNISDLVWNDYDPDGDPISFVGVSATSSNGLALTTNATQILVPANTLADGFSYTIADSHGLTATGTATIAIITNVTSRAISLDRAANGTATISFTGVPWYFYECQRATNVTFVGTLQTWPVQAWADGSISVWDDFTDLPNQPSQVFYRLRSTP